MANMYKLIWDLRLFCYCLCVFWFVPKNLVLWKKCESLSLTISLYCSNFFKSQDEQRNVLCWKTSTGKKLFGKNFHTVTFSTTKYSLRWKFHAADFPHRNFLYREIPQYITLHGKNFHVTMYTHCHWQKLLSRISIWWL